MSESHGYRNGTVHTGSVPLDDDLDLAREERRLRALDDADTTVWGARANDGFEPDGLFSHADLARWAFFALWAVACGVVGCIIVLSVVR